MLGITRQVVKKWNSTSLLKKQDVAKIFGVVVQSRALSFGEMIQYVRFNYMNDPRHHLDNDKWAKLFCIEGNVGAGKAPFAKEFAERLELKYCPAATINSDVIRARERGDMTEEEAEWNLNPQSVLQQGRALSDEKMCKSPDDSVHTIRYQVQLLLNRYRQYYDSMAHLLYTGQGAVMVRHFYSDMVHAEALRKMGYIGKDDWDFYDVVQYTIDTQLISPQVVLYLDVPPEQCYENIQAGDNEADKHLTLDYLRRVEEAYKTKYFPEARERGVNVIEIDWSGPTSVNEVIDELDALPTMLSSTCWWNVQNSKLVRIMKLCMNERYRHNLASIYIPKDELWYPLWYEYGLAYEKRHAPWKYKKGYNAALGDRWIFFRG